MPRCPCIWAHRGWRGALDRQRVATGQLAAGGTALASNWRGWLSLARGRGLGDLHIFYYLPRNHQVEDKLRQGRGANLGNVRHLLLFPRCCLPRLPAPPEFLRTRILCVQVGSRPPGPGSPRSREGRGTRRARAETRPAAGWRVSAWLSRRPLPGPGDISLPSVQTGWWQGRSLRGPPSWRPSPGCPRLFSGTSLGAVLSLSVLEELVLPPDFPLRSRFSHSRRVSVSDARASQPASAGRWLAHGRLAPGRACPTPSLEAGDWAALPEPLGPGSAPPLRWGRGHWCHLQ